MSSLQCVRPYSSSPSSSTILLLPVLDSLGLSALSQSSLSSTSLDVVLFRSFQVLLILISISSQQIFCVLSSKFLEG